MQEQADNVTCEARPEQRGNRGWFQARDPRINREGRPRGSKLPTAAEEDHAPRADRLKVLRLPLAELVRRLSHGECPKGDDARRWISNLPYGCEIVGARIDPARGVISLVLRSQAFPRVARGAVIPEFQARLGWVREPARCWRCGAEPRPD